MGLRQQQADHDQVHHGEAGGPPGRKNPVHLTEQATQAGAEGEAQPEGDPDQPKGFGPVFRCGDVSQHRCGRGGGSTAHPIDGAGEEQQHQRQAGGRCPWPDLLPGQCESDGKQSHPHDGSGDADRDHWPASVAVAEGSNQRCHRKLGKRVGARQQSDGAATAAEIRQQKGEQRQKNALAEPIVEQRQKRAQQGGDAGALQGDQRAGETHIPTGPMA